MMAKNIIQLPGSEPNGVPMERVSIYSRMVKVPDEFRAPEWIINGIIPEGVGIIAGASGVGKTTAIVPLALAVAGFKSPVCDLEVELPRKIVYITEDDRQVITILQGMREFLKWDDDTWAKVKASFMIVPSLRLSPQEVQWMLIECLAETTTHKGIDIPPLTVIDTSSANFDLMDENSNSQVSIYMSILKEIYARQRLSIWVSTHLTKDSKGQGVDALDNKSARGGGAFEGDATWTAILSSEEANNQGARILKINKTREQSSDREIRFEGSVQHATAINRFGEEIQIDYRYTVPRRCNIDLRRLEAFDKKNQERSQIILDVIDDLEYPSKTELKDASGFRDADAFALIKLMLDRRELIELPLPENVKKSRRKTYIARGEVEGSDDAF